jgi:phosphatidylinositol alpha-1,6-mannosyltransferase
MPTHRRHAGTIRYKGQDRVIVALPTLIAQGQEVLYLIIGEGDDRRRLEAYARALGVTENVKFLGLVDAETLVEAYRAADLFVMPSTGEGFGIAFLEAMASGTPALGLAVGGACDALADGELGVAVSETEALAEAISRELSSRTRDPGHLSSATCVRFGREAFVARVGAALTRLSEAT